jgi:hypothetical protein
VIQGEVKARGDFAVNFGMGDVRVAARAEWLVERIVATGSLVLRQLGGSRAGEVAVHRFLSSPYSSVEAIVETLASRTAQQCVGRRVVAIQDTSEVNFKGRAARRRGLGPGGNGKDPGFFLHPVIAVDAEDEAVIGLIGAQIWTRGSVPVGERRGRSLAEKEAMRWHDGCTTTARLLAEAAAVTMIIRAAQDRSLAGSGRLFAALDEAPELTRRRILVPPSRPGERSREATLAIKAGSVQIARPKNRKAEPDAVRSVTLTLVQAIEIDPPDPQQAVAWRLLTTHPVDGAAAAAEIIDLYRLRWRIEQVFRALKSDGLGLEDTQLADAERLFILAAMGLAAAVRTLQLVDARDGSPRPATDAVDPDLLTPLAAISRSLEGNTPRQKNPHPPTSLAFLSWVTARLGGWNCYGKPPGPKTMHHGWKQLAAMLQGYALATQAPLP